MARNTDLPVTRHGPVIIVGFSRGGTNLVLNMLRSSPALCSPRGETQEVFLGKGNDPAWKKLLRRLLYVPIAGFAGPNFLNPRNYDPRRKYPSFLYRYLRFVLHLSKTKARGAHQNRFKTPDEIYTPQELRGARLLLKQIDGLVLATRAFNEVFPGATFVAVLRSLDTLLAAKSRHGEQVGDLKPEYETFVREIRSLQAEGLRLKIFHFEDLVTNPQIFVQELYRFVGLPRPAHYRLEIKNSALVRLEGKPGPKKMVWVPERELSRYILTM